MLGDKLQKLRSNKGLNMKQTAEKLGIPYTTYFGYEKDDREPNSETLIKLADFFNCSVDYLIGNTIELDFSPHEIEDDCKIICPVCGYDYVHFIRTMGVSFITTKSSGIALEFKGECEHKFYIVIETYKGNTYIVKTDENNVIYSSEKLPFEASIISLKDLVESEKINEFNKKFRTLDEYGKKAITELLNIEYDRCIKSNKSDIPSVTASRTNTNEKSIKQELYKI